MSASQAYRNTFGAQTTLQARGGSVEFFHLAKLAEVGAVLEGLDLEAIDDFRLYSATLEDLYVHYATTS